MRSGVTIDGMRTHGSSPARRVANSRVSRKKSATNFGLSRDDTSLRKARLKANEDFLKPVSTLEFDLSSKELKPDYSLRHRDETEAPRKHAKKNKSKKKGHKVTIVLLVIVFILALGAGGALIWGDKIISKLTGGNSGIFDFIGAITSNVKLKTDANGRTNVLIFGTSGYDMDGEEGDGVHDGAQLTDSIMVVSIDQESGDTAMVSLPRDLYVGNTCTSTGKVNEVYFCANLYGNDEAGGADALKATMKEIFGLDIQYRVHVDWAALVQIVDGLGGITVTLDEDIEDTWTNTFIKAGEPVTLNGEQALGLARARHGTEMGDFTRGNSQQKILGAIQNKIVESGLDLGTALSLVDIVGDNVRMDFNIEELKTLFYLAKDISLDEMRQIPLIDYDKNIYYLSTAMMNNISYVVPAAGIRNYKSIQDYVQGELVSDPAVRENPVIAVLNGSGEAGVAGAEKSELEKLGFKTVQANDAPEGEYSDKYYLYDISGKKQHTLTKLAEKYNTNVRPATDLPEGIDTTGVDVVVILGEGGTAQ
ncbi:LCP family protein [Candidatus Saccharibacteria bacterium]|nr:LCP family protein [Candidatus Saccharibacteria bacterium]